MGLGSGSSESSESSKNSERTRDSDDFSDVHFDGVSDFFNYPLNLELPHYRDHLTFIFSAIDWEAPHKIRYQYKLDGLDRDWSKLGTETKAEYRNLPPGTFSFRVKAIGAADRWSESFVYNFIVLPPWWSTWWAYTVYLVLAFVTVLLIVRLNISPAREAKRTTRGGCGGSHP